MNVRLLRLAYRQGNRRMWGRGGIILSPAGISRKHGPYPAELRMQLPNAQGDYLFVWMYHLPRCIVAARKALRALPPESVAYFIDPESSK